MGDSECLRVARGRQTSRCHSVFLHPPRGKTLANLFFGRARRFPGGGHRRSVSTLFLRARFARVNVLFSESGETQFLTRLPSATFAADSFLLYVTQLGLDTSWREPVPISRAQATGTTALSSTSPSLRNPLSLKSISPQRNYQHCLRTTLVTRTFSTVPLVIRVSGSPSREGETLALAADRQTKSGAAAEDTRKSFFLPRRISTGSTLPVRLHYRDPVGIARVPPCCTWATDRVLVLMLLLVALLTLRVPRGVHSLTGPLHGFGLGHRLFQVRLHTVTGSIPCQDERVSGVRKARGWNVDSISTSPSYPAVTCLVSCSSEWYEKLYLLGDGFSIFWYSARLVRQWIHAHASVPEVFRESACTFCVKMDLAF